MKKSCFTSESVTRGHPDKVCDQIADRILDELLRQDPESHVACEVTCSTDQVHIFGEITSDAVLNYEEIARNVIAQIGYTEKERGFDAETCAVRVNLHEQSPDIARGVCKKGGKESLDHGAGDQGMMFGYACRQTDSLMPFPIETAHALARRLEQVREMRLLPYLLPDGKTQVTVEYEGETPIRIAAVVVSAQHREDVDIEQLRGDVTTHVILPILPVSMVDQNTEIFINPTGRFVEGGPAADSGLTGRKLIVDTYGGYARHGGGAFSGKDASKVDRSGAYMARYMAKNIVAAGLADRCEVQLSYAIGLSDPMSVRIDTFNSAHADESAILARLSAHVDPRPAAIIRKFNLTAPQFSRVACYGHFGTNALELPWEQTDIARALQM